MSFRYWVAVLLFAAIPLTVQGQVTLTYQGMLGDAVGRPVDGARLIVFRLYEGAEGGEPVWEEVHPDVDIVDGSFFAVLGRQADLPADGRLHFLGVQVEGEPEFSPRMTLGGAVRANWAAVAEQAEDVWDRAIHPRSVTIGDTEVIDEQGNWVGPPPAQPNAAAGGGLVLRDMDGELLGSCFSGESYIFFDGYSGRMLPGNQGTHRLDARVVFFEDAGCNGRAFTYGSTTSLQGRLGVPWVTLDERGRPWTWGSLFDFSVDVLSVLEDDGCRELGRVFVIERVDIRGARELIRAEQLDEHPLVVGVRSKLWPAGVVPMP